MSTQTRGRSVPMSDQEHVLQVGTGWVPADLAINAFGLISPDNIFGSIGDLRLLPDRNSVVDIPSDSAIPGVRDRASMQARESGPGKAPGRWILMIPGDIWATDRLLHLQGPNWIARRLPAFRWLGWNLGPTYLKAVDRGSKNGRVLLATSAAE